MERMIYVVSDGKRAATSTRKRPAVRLAKREQCEVHVMPARDYYAEGYPYGWDVPTFRMCATRIYPRLED